MKITITQIQKQHNVNKLHDALDAANLEVKVESKPDESESYLTFDDADAQAVQAVIDAYNYVPPTPPPDFKALLTDIASVDLDAPTTLPQMKVAVKQVLVKIEAALKARWGIS